MSRVGFIIVVSLGAVVRKVDARPGMTEWRWLELLPPLSSVAGGFHSWIRAFCVQFSPERKPRVYRICRIFCASASTDS